jgi:hypothetical protein
MKKVQQTGAIPQNRVDRNESDLNIDELMWRSGEEVKHTKR